MRFKAGLLLWVLPAAFLFWGVGEEAVERVGVGVGAGGGWRSERYRHVCERLESGDKYMAEKKNDVFFK